MNFRTFIPLLAVVLALVPPAELAAEILPVGEVKKGMKGYGLTIFEGNEVERFEVEILGVLPKMGPSQDLILARVDSELLKRSGVIAGMSGSPIFIDGKLIGALAYSWQFAKDPIAGITPIEEMLRLAQNGAGSGSPMVAASADSRALIEALLDPRPEALEPMFAALARPAGGTSAALPIAVPLSFGNFASETLDRFGRMFEAGGFLAVPAGSTASGAALERDAAKAPFEPGDAIGAVLLQGDFSVAATGTVTHVDGDRVWAFGHPFLDMGAIEFPMAKAEVIAVMSSVARSFKFSNSGEVVGALQQDRSSGIFGTVGAVAEMIPVELTLEGSRGLETFEFQLARHPMLSPLLLAMVADSVVAVAQRAAGERTIMLDSEITIDGFAEPIRVRDGWAGPEARQSIPVYLAVISSYLLSNEYVDAPIRAIRLRLRHEDDLRLARLLQASVETPSDGQINPGDTIRVNAMLKPYRGEAFLETFEVKIPETTRPGNAFIFVGGGRVANRLDFSLVPPDPRSLPQMVGVIERLRSSTDLTVGLYSPTEGAVSAGVYHPSLPPSMQAVITADSTNSSAAPVRVDAPVRESRTLDYIVDGAVRVDIRIRPRL
ncbi:MAG TPA: SpoIVB peptidase S55 domain-containing protein [Thermoanaerobaculia bacterium]|nr:SpoIVB peptidase S55 domain-containing protein [Thermoanaerobaculia bacterium]